MTQPDTDRHIHVWYDTANYLCLSSNIHICIYQIENVYVFLLFCFVNYYTLL